MIVKGFIGGYYVVYYPVPCSAPVHHILEYPHLYIYIDTLYPYLYLSLFISCHSLRVPARTLANIARTPLINLLIKLMTIKQESFELTPGELRRIVKCGFMRSFYPGSHGEKQAYVKSVMSYYDAVALRHGVAAPTGEFE